jgi:hypothetical protein
MFTPKGMSFCSTEKGLLGEFLECTTWPWIVRGGQNGGFVFVDGAYKNIIYNETIEWDRLEWKDIRFH